MHCPYRADTCVLGVSEVKCEECWSIFQNSGDQSTSGHLAVLGHQWPPAARSVFLVSALLEQAIVCSAMDSKGDCTCVWLKRNWILCQYMVLITGSILPPPFKERDSFKHINYIIYLKQDIGRYLAIRAQQSCFLVLIHQQEFHQLIGWWK